MDHCSHVVTYLNCVCFLTRTMGWWHANIRANQAWWRYYNEMTGREVHNYVSCFTDGSE